MPIIIGTKNPRINGNINPRINGNINPRINGNINPRINGNINPRINGNINPRINGNINPRINGNINPRINGNINPRINGNINPRINGNINPNLNSGFDGFYVFDLDANPILFIILTGNNDVIQFFNFELENTMYGVKTNTGYAIFSLGQEYLGHLESDGGNGFNYFDTNNEWTAFIK